MLPNLSHHRSLTKVSLLPEPQKCWMSKDDARMANTGLIRVILALGFPINTTICLYFVNNYRAYTVLWATCGLRSKMLLSP